MRSFIFIGLTILTCAGCRHGIETIAGAYEMVRYEGKPLPFGGVRGGELSLMADGTLLLVTHRAVRIGEAETTVDTLAGTFGLETWGSGCVTIWMRAPEFLRDPNAFGEVCGKELTTFYNGGLFRKRAHGLPSGTPSNPARSSVPASVH